jgi:AraC-like DNA-binding protein
VENLARRRLAREAARTRRVKTRFLLEPVKKEGLLQEPPAEISKRTGFAHVEYLSVVFKRETGLPPSKFRTLNQ